MDAAPSQIGPHIWMKFTLMKNTFSSSTIPLPKHSALPEPSASTQLLLDLPCEQQLVEELSRSLHQQLHRLALAPLSVVLSDHRDVTKSFTGFLLTEYSCT